ncbi:MAG: extracellular solute-binding protein [Clostridia bacterium]|nr:extracellular solute-binding protein [Clostridia bacterium]
MKRILSLIMLAVVCLGYAIFAGLNKTETIIIYTSTEDYNMELLQKTLNQQFPSYNIHIEYYSTSNVASRIIEEGEFGEADIVYCIEYGYLEKMKNANVLANIKDMYDYQLYTDDVVEESIRDYVLPGIRNGGAIIINNTVLQQLGVSKPTCYEDLLNPKLQSKISMPSPKSSGTGYMFLLALINEWGEEKALSYFDKLEPNILAFESSGSGPVNQLIKGEVAVGFGMTAQAVDKISSGRDDIDVLFFDEGSPYSLYGSSIVKGKETRSSVAKVFKYIADYYNELACSMFYPEAIFKDKSFKLDNFPEGIVYSNMEKNTLSRKNNILNKWKF